MSSREIYGTEPGWRPSPSDYRPGTDNAKFLVLPAHGSQNWIWLGDVTAITYSLDESDPALQLVTVARHPRACEHQWRPPSTYYGNGRDVQSCSRCGEARTVR